MRAYPVVRWAVAIIIVVFFVIAVNVFLLFQVTVTDNSFSPRLQRGDRVLMSRVSEIRRGDIVAYRNPLHDAGMATLSLGECVALPGDTLRLFLLSEKDSSCNGCGVWRTVQVPSKGGKVKVESWNIKLLSNVLYTYDGKNVCEQCDSVLVVNGIPRRWVTFSSDYVWLKSGERGRKALDSRVCGFFPVSAVQGKAMCVTYSINPQKEEFLFSRVWKDVR